VRTARGASSRAVPSSESLPSREAPWAAGLRAARANVVPGLIVQGMMLALLLAYFFHPPATLLLGRLAALKERWSYGYSAMAAIIAGAVIPELLRISVFQKLRPHRGNLANLAFAIPFWGFMGVVVDGFYRLQAVWFGTEASISVVLPKVLVDQFVYNPLFAAPLTTAMYDWKNRGYGRRGPGACSGMAWYRDAVVPTLFATWGVWIPVVTIVYSLPSLLQIPLFGFALSMWVMLYTWMSERRAGV
jgi:hypothetical protein